MHKISACPLLLLLPYPFLPCSVLFASSHLRWPLAEILHSGNPRNTRGRNQNSPSNQFPNTQHRAVDKGQQHIHKDGCAQ